MIENMYVNCFTKVRTSLESTEALNIKAEKSRIGLESTTYDTIDVIIATTIVVCR